MNWTNEQLDVINTREKNILVSAAAGSGKTAVLVERIVKLTIEDEIPIENFLIVTFTNAAAKGMKLKIQNAFNNILSNSKNFDRNYITYIRKQSNNLSKSSISTIHVFCLDIIRNNFNYLDLDPAFRIGDEIECSLMLNEAIEEILEHKFEENNPSFIKIVNSFSGNRTDDKLISLLKDIYTFIQSFPEPNLWLTSEIEKLNIEDKDLDKSDWIENILSDINEQLNSFIEYSSLRDIEKSLSNKEDEFSSAAISSDKLIVNYLKSSLSKGYEDFTKDLLNIEFKAKSRAKKVPKEIENGIVTDLNIAYKYCSKNLSDELKKLQSSLPNKSIDELSADIQYMYPLLKTMSDLVIQISDLFQLKKREKSIIDFNDFEHLAYKALSNPEIANYYKDKYDYIFVDEYQDSNQIQESLISKIKKDNNLFMVGDSKQSIYKFRLADVEIFTKKMKSYSLLTSEKDKRIDLNKNFRSRKEILCGINHIFSNIMTEKLGELNYDESVFLYPGMEFYSDETTVPELALILNSTTSTSDDNTLNTIKDIKKQELEAHFIANKIIKLIDKPIYSANSKEAKLATYKDIVILMRSTTSWSEIFQNVFIEYGIPFYQDAGSGYYDTLEIQIVLNYLKIIDNLRQDIPLLSIMRSPLYKFNADELTIIRLNKTNCSYIDAVLNYSKTHDDAISSKISKLLSDIKKFKQTSHYIDVNELIWNIVIETKYYDFIGLLPNGKLRQANIRLLTAKAKDYESTSMTGLYNFIKYIDKIKFSNKGNSEAKIIAENANVVRLMTIHKSKGLEFPIVFICGLNKQFNMLDTKSTILKHKTYGLAPKYLNADIRAKRETIPRYAIKNIIKKEALSEEMRILYVALTRAVDKLILTASFDSIEKKSKIWKKEPSYYNLLSSKSYIDWIMMVLYKHKDCKELRESLEDLDSYGLVDKENTKWNINIFSQDDINFEESTIEEDSISHIEEIESTNIDKNEYCAVDKILSYSYPNPTATMIPTKMSVTEIKRYKNKEKKIADLNINIPKLLSIPSFKISKQYTAAEIGTLTHTAMQHIRLDRTNTLDDINMQLQNMADKGIIKSEELEVINAEKIFAFFTNDLGTRMLASKQIYREAPFIYKMKANSIYNNYENSSDEIIVQGIIDCYFIEDNKIILIDYKTDKITDLEITKAQYLAQIKSYSEALEKITNMTVSESYLYLFDIDSAIEIY